MPANRKAARGIEVVVMEDPNTLVELRGTTSCVLVDPNQCLHLPMNASAVEQACILINDAFR